MVAVGKNVRVFRYAKDGLETDPFFPDIALCLLLCCSTDFTDSTHITIGKAGFVVLDNQRAIRSFATRRVTFR